MPVRRSARIRAKTPKKSSSLAPQPYSLHRSSSWEESRGLRTQKLFKQWETLIIRLLDVDWSSHNVERALMDYKAKIEAERSTWKTRFWNAVWWGLVVFLLLTTFLEFHFDAPVRISWWRFSNDPSVLLQVGDWGLDKDWWKRKIDKLPLWFTMLATSFAPWMAVNFNRCLVFLFGKSAKEYLRIDDAHVAEKMQQVRINISLNSLVESPNEPAELRMRTLDEKAWSEVFTQSDHTFLFNELLYGYSSNTGVLPKVDKPPSHTHCVQCNVELHDWNRAETEHEACIHGSLCREHENSRECELCKKELTMATLTKNASPFLSLGRIPRLGTDMRRVAKTVRDHCVNLLSKTSSQGFLAQDFGRPSDSQQYAYGVTFEDQDDGKNRKLRILLMRVDTLDRLHKLSQIAYLPMKNAWQRGAPTVDRAVGFKHDQSAADVSETRHYHAYCRDRCEQLLKMRRILKGNCQEYRRCLPIGELDRLLKAQKALSLCGYVYLSVP